eukprot:COSAG02_NODE_34633_length_481_cov_0.675393_1_plen_52_part_01
MRSRRPPSVTTKRFVFITVLQVGIDTVDMGACCSVVKVAGWMPHRGSASPRQ